MDEIPFQAAPAFEQTDASSPASVPAGPPKKKGPSLFMKLFRIVFFVVLIVGCWFGYKAYASGKLDDLKEIPLVGTLVKKAKSFLPGVFEEEPPPVLASNQTIPEPPAAPAGDRPTPSAVSSPASPETDPSPKSAAPVAPADSPPPTVSPVSSPSTPTPDPKLVVDTPSPTKPATPRPRVDPSEILRQDLEEKPDSPPSLYVKLANSYLSQKAPEKAEEILNKGLVQYPLNGEITLTLADSMAAQSKKEEAWMMIARTGRTGDLRFASKLLQLGLESGKADETLVILDPALTGKMEWSSSDWENMAKLHEKVGNFDNAILLLSKIPEGENQIPRIQAKQAHAEKDFTKALKLQSQYVSSLKKPDPEAWTFYADLHRLAGNTEEADEAYKQALSDLKKRDSGNG